MRYSKKHFTVKDIADYCMVDRATVRRWIRAGRLSATQLPSSHYRISLEDFRAFLERWHMPVEGWLLESESAKKGGNS